MTVYHVQQYMRSTYFSCEPAHQPALFALAGRTTKGTYLTLAHLDNEHTGISLLFIAYHRTCGLHTVGYSAGGNDHTNGCRCPKTLAGRSFISWAPTTCPSRKMQAHMGHVLRCKQIIPGA
jgi:hypothetical protein